jgi:hypothetical protein
MSPYCISGVPISVTINRREFVTELSLVGRVNINGVIVSYNTAEVKMCVSGVNVPDCGSGDVTEPTQILGWSGTVNIWHSLFRPRYDIERLWHDARFGDAADDLIEVRGLSVSAIAPYGHSFKIPIALNLSEGVVHRFEINESPINNRILPVGGAGDLRLSFHDPRLTEVDYDLRGS